MQFTIQINSKTHNRRHARKSRQQCALPPWDRSRTMANSFHLPVLRHESRPAGTYGP